MTNRLMSDAEIKRRKKIQARSSQATGALGLTALTGTMLATKRGGRATKAVLGRERPEFLEPKKLKRKTAPILATSAGIGGATSFNFASYTDAESRKRKPVVKSYESPFEDVAYVGTIDKAFDPEESRRKRMKGYENATIAGAGAGGAITASRGIKAAEKIKGLKGVDSVTAAENPQAARFVAGKDVFRAVPSKNIKSAAKATGKVGTAAAATGAAVYANKKIREKKKTSWSSYAKSAGTSAFGVNHSD